MSDFSARLREERVRLGLTQQEMAAIGGVKLNAQSNYETGKRSPDAEYLEALAMHDVDVAYVLTGHRMHMAGYVAPLRVQVQMQGADTDVPKPTLVQGVAEDRLAYESKPAKFLREVTQEEAALLDNYEAADEKGRAAARSVLDALAEPKKRAHG